MDNLPIIRNKGHRRSILSKYQRHLMIVAIAEMILQGKLRSDVINVVHQTYGYSIKTVNDLICEAQTYAATQLTEEEKSLIKNQIIGVGRDILLKEDNDNFSRLKAGELLGKIVGAFSPQIAIQNNIINLNQDLNEKLKGCSVEQLLEINEILNPNDSEK